MTPNLVGVVTIGVLILIFLLICRLQRSTEGVQWPDLLKKEIEDGDEPRPPGGIKFYYV